MIIFPIQIKPNYKKHDYINNSNSKSFWGPGALKIGQDLPEAPKVGPGAPGIDEK